MPTCCFQTSFMKPDSPEELRLGSNAVGCLSSEYVIFCRLLPLDPRSYHFCVVGKLQWARRSLTSWNVQSNSRQTRNTSLLRVRSCVRRKWRGQGPLGEEGLSEQTPAFEQIPEWNEGRSHALFGNCCPGGGNSKAKAPVLGRVLYVPRGWRELEGEVIWEPGPPCGGPVGHREDFKFNPHSKYLISLICFSLIKYFFPWERCLTKGMQLKYRRF